MFVLLPTLVLLWSLMPDVMIVVSPRFTKPSLTAAETAFAIISSTSFHCVPRIGYTPQRRLS